MYNTSHKKHLRHCRLIDPPSYTKASARLFPIHAKVATILPSKSSVSIRRMYMYNKDILTMNPLSRRVPG